MSIGDGSSWDHMDKGWCAYVSRKEGGNVITYMGRRSLVDVVYVALQKECHMRKRVVVADDVRQVRVGFAANVGKTSRVGEGFWMLWRLAFRVD